MKDLLIKYKILIFSSCLILFVLLLFFCLNENKIFENIAHYNNGASPIIDIKNDDKLSYNFKSGVNNLNTLSVQIGTYGKNYDDILLNFKLFDENKKLVYQENVSSENIVDCGYYTLFFDRVENSLSKNFTLELICKNCDKNHHFALFGNPSSDLKSTVYQENINLNASLTMDISGTYYSSSLIVVCLIFIIIFSLLLISEFVKKHDRLNLNLKWKLFLKEFILSLSLSILVCKVIIDFKYDFVISNLYFILILLLLECLLFVLYSIIHSKPKMQYIYLTLAILIGSFYLVLIIPNQVADENVHYYSAYDLSNGALMTDDFYVKVPEEIINNDHNVITNYDALRGILFEKTDYSNTKTVLTSGYSNLLYFPSAIVIAVARALSLPIFIGFYMARVVGLIIALIIGYNIVKFIPIGKKFISIYMLSPMYINQSMSLSADSLTNSIILFFIAYVLYLKFKSGGIDKKNILILSLTMLFISATKYIYIPMVFLIFLLYSRRNELSKKVKYILGSALILSLLFCIIGYLYRTFGKETVDNSYVVATNVNFTSQVKYILYNPIDFIGVLIRTMQTYGGYYLDTFLGSSLGWLNINISGILIDIYFILLVISPFLEKEKYEFNTLEKRLILILFFGIFLLVLVALYAGWSSVGDSLVRGVQGRYFIPIAALLGLIASNKKRYLNFPNCEFKIFIFMIVLHLIILSEVISSFL